MKKTTIFILCILIIGVLALRINPQRKELHAISKSSDVENENQADADTGNNKGDSSLQASNKDNPDSNSIDNGVSAQNVIVRKQYCPLCKELGINRSEVVEGYDYCSSHLCNVPDCTLGTWHYYRCCVNHSWHLNGSLLERRENLCAIRWCHNEPKEGSNFCEEHICEKCTKGVEPKHSYCGEHVWYEADRTNFISGKDKKFPGISSSGSKSKGTSNKRNNMVDPDDYDNPDDYADDAYGSDFDDWDEAYEYWENY